MSIRAGQERQALRASIAHLFERSSVLREHEILAEALNQSLGSVDLESVETSRLTWRIRTRSPDGLAGKPAAF